MSFGPIVTHKRTIRSYNSIQLCGNLTKIVLLSLLMLPLETFTVAKLNVNKIAALLSGLQVDGCSVALWLPAALLPAPVASRLPLPDRSGIWRCFFGMCRLSSHKITNWQNNNMLPNCHFLSHEVHFKSGNSTLLCCLTYFEIRMQFF